MKRTVRLTSDLARVASFYLPSYDMYYRGAYPDYASALASVPKGRRLDFDAEWAPDLYTQKTFAFNEHDYPMVYWLTKIFQAEQGKAQRVFDLGGGVGQSYYTYGNYLAPPEDFGWTVCDVAQMVKSGSALAQQRDAKALSFTTAREKAAGATILLTLGALQYVEVDLAAILASLSTMPEHLLVNRVPLFDGQTYYTVQSSRNSFYAPYRIANLSLFVKQVEACGYELQDQWQVTRSHRMPLRPDLDVSAYYGFYFKRPARPDGTSVIQGA